MCSERGGVGVGGSMRKTRDSAWGERLEEVVGGPEEFGKGVAACIGAEDVGEGRGAGAKGGEAGGVVLRAVKDDMCCRMRDLSKRGGTWARGVITGTRAKLKGVGRGEGVACRYLDPRRKEAE